MLQTSDVFPALSFPRAGGGEIHLPTDLTGSFGVILFYRGAWSELCLEQLRAFTQASDRIASEGIRVVAVSTDKRETAEALAARHGLPFPIGYVTDAREVSSLAGIMVNDDNAFLEAAGFVIDPDARILTAMYSSIEGFEERIVTVVYSAADIRRLMPDDVLRIVAEAKSTASR